jgi:hypothetical protein
MAKRKQPAALARYWAARRGKTKSRALVRHTGSKVVVRHHHHKAKPAKRRRHHDGGGGTGMTVVKVILAGAALGLVTSGPGSDATGIRAKVYNFFADTIPGGKTFGADATLGATALVIDRFFWKNKWLRLAGYIGIAIAAVKLGKQNTDFKWLGDVGHDDDDYVADVG